MKSSAQILNLLLAVALVVVVVKSALSSDPVKEESTNTTTSQGMDTIEAIMTRTSVRSYTPQKVEAYKVETMLRAGMAAPTGGNRQPWRFVVVDDKEVLNQFPPIIKGASMASRAPLAIVVCGVPSEGMGGILSEYWIQDTSAATENILLSAHALDLGAVWCGVYPNSGGRVEAIQGVLNLPEDIIPLSIIVIGYPDSEPHIKDKWRASNVYYNQYE